MRQLKHHESKLLRKVDLYSWKCEKNIKVAKVIRRYHIQDQEDYVTYNRIVGNITQLANKLKKLKKDDTFRIAMTDELLSKLFNIGIITSKKSLQKAEEVTVSAICRRRLPVIMVRLKMAETMRAAVSFIEQGHVRIGPNVVTESSTLVTRTMEDFVTWVDSSKIKKTVLKYNDQLDDFDLL